jgi:hypothetical protein
MDLKEEIAGIAHRESGGIKTTLKKSQATAAIVTVHRFDEHNSPLRCSVGIDSLGRMR